MSLAQRHALVTGSTSGIGLAIARALAKEGADVVINGFGDQAAIETERAKIEKEFGVKAFYNGADMSKEPEIEAMVADAQSKMGSLDILVSNAGILKYAPLLDLTDADCENMFRTNVLASFRITTAVARSMAQRRRGHIIVMTSIAAREVYRLGVIYCATKHALSAFTRGLRIELQGYGIKVTEIAPGMVDTDIRASSDHPSVIEALKARKFEALTAAEVAEAVVYAANAAPNCCPDLIELRPQGSA